MRDIFYPDVPNYASATFPAQRPFQLTAHEALRDGVKAGHKNQIVMAPTGAGKTYLGLRIAHEALLRGKRATFVCDRKTLIGQTSTTADEYGLSAHGIIQADNWRTDLSMPFQIASAQTLKGRGWPESDVIIIDECHSMYSIWTDYINNCGAVVIGLSATPFSKGLGKYFTNLVNATTMHDLTESGVLVPMRVYSCTQTDMRGAKTKGKNGEWDDDDVAKRGMEIVGDVVTEWKKYGENRKTIVFGATVKHCEELTRQFNDAGVMAAVYCGGTKDVERDELLKEYRKPDSMLRVLVSVEALAKGFDVPDVGCIVDCRPLRKSLSTAIQMWGRGLRSSPNTGKTDCILLDHSGNILRFAEDYSDIFFNGLAELDSGEKLDKTIRKEQDQHDAKSCPSCGYTPFAKRCISCGYEHISPSLIEHQPGEMHQITLGKKVVAENIDHLGNQLAAYARSHSAPEKQKYRYNHLFKAFTGKEPTGAMSFATRTNAEITKNVMNKIRSMNIAYSRARAKA